MQVHVKFSPNTKHINKIAAIKSVRAISGCSLREAKECTEGLYPVTKFVNLQDIENCGVNVDNLKDCIRSNGGLVCFGVDEWLHYKADIKEMLFRAEIQGHECVIYELRKILDIIRHTQ